MPTTCTWDDEARSIIYITYEGSWTWEEYHEAADVARAMALSVAHRVDYIGNFQMGSSPRGESQIAHGRAVMQQLPQNVGIVVTVDNLFTKTLLGIFKAVDRQLGAIIFGATSVEEARAIIAEHRASRGQQV